MLAAPPDPIPPDPASLSERRERRALQVLAFAAALVIIRVALPLGVGLLIGALLAFVLQPLYVRLTTNKKAKFKPSTAALVLSLGSTLLLGGVVFALGDLIVSQGVQLLGGIPQSFAPGGELHSLAQRGTALFSTFHVDPNEVLAKARDAAMAVGARAAGLAAVVAGATFEGLLTLLFLTMTTFYVLLHWTAIVRRGERDLPFRPAHTRALLDEFRLVGREVLFGTISAGLIQGVLAALGYWITGVPRPALFGAITAIASLIPAVGTVLAWGAIGVFRILTGHPASGISELIYSALVVGIVVDYVIRPRLVGGRDNMPALLTFVGLLGGTAVFGLIGLILGPVILTMCVAVLKIYDQDVPAHPEIHRDG